MNIVLFDGECNLCNGVVSFIIRRDKKALFRFAAIQSRTGQTLLKRYAVRESELTTLYYFRNHHCWQKSAAVLYIFRDLGGFWRFLFPLIYLPSFLRDFVYLFVSRRRYRWFGKRKSCVISTQDAKRRFIGS